MRKSESGSSNSVWCRSSRCCVRPAILYGVLESVAADPCAILGAWVKTGLSSAYRDNDEELMRLYGLIKCGEGSAAASMIGGDQGPQSTRLLGIELADVLKVASRLGMPQGARTSLLAH